MCVRGVQGTTKLNQLYLLLCSISKVVWQSPSISHPCWVSSGKLPSHSFECFLSFTPVVLAPLAFLKHTSTDGAERPMKTR